MSIVAKTNIKREPGYLYYIDSNGNIARTKMNRKGGKKGRTVCTKKAAKKTAKRVVKKKAPKKIARKKVARKSPSKRK